VYVQHGRAFFESLVQRYQGRISGPLMDVPSQMGVDDSRRYWYPRLAHATDSERRHWQLLGDGYAIEWPDLDEHIGVEDLLAGRRSGKSERSLRQWLEERKPHS
jgi:hypothetical protein